MQNPIIVDAHQDIAWNKIAMGRDFLESARHKRAREGAHPAHGEGSAVVGFDEIAQANVRVIFATLYVSPKRAGGPKFGKMYATAQEAHDQALEQLAYYALLAADPRVSLITSRKDLDSVVTSDKHKVGLVLLMEGADPIVEPAQVEEWHARGVRIVGTSWGKTRYAGGTGAPDGLSELGKKLVPRLSEVGFILDASHMSDAAFFESLDLFEGTVIASHSNCRAYVNTDRQLSDEMIKRILERDGVIGAVIYNRFIKVGWEKGARKEDVTLADVVRHTERICDLAGDALHVGIGSDFDGGYGAESIPAEFDTIADLPRFIDVLGAARFSDEDIENFLGGNWVRMLKRALPA